MEFRVTFNTEYLELKNRSEELSEELANVIQEYSHMTGAKYRCLLADYVSRIGVYEKEQFAWYTKALSIKRKLGLMQSSINRGQEANITDIEKQVQEELKCYYDRLDEMRSDLEFAKEYKKAEFLSEEDTKELKTIYKKLVKMLHPDVLTDPTDKERQMWEQTVEAYDTGNLDMLRAIADVCSNQAKDDPTEQFNNPNIIQELKSKCENLISTITNYKGKIERMKGMFPFNKEELLKSEIEVRNCREQLIKSAEEWRKYCEELEEKVGVIKPTYADV